jgi:hypothetical protein
VNSKAIVVGAVLITILLLVAMLLAVALMPGRNITVRHLQSTRTGNVTTMSFEVKNSTPDHYIYFPFELQLRTGKTWTKFQGFDVTKIHPAPKIDPGAVASYTLEVTNLPPGSLARFAIRPQRILQGLDGFVRRADLELKRKTSGAGGGSIPLNPYDRNSQVYGKPTEVVSDEFMEVDR